MHFRNGLANKCKCVLCSEYSVQLRLFVTQKILKNSIYLLKKKKKLINQLLVNFNY